MAYYTKSDHLILQWYSPNSLGCSSRWVVWSKPGPMQPAGRCWGSGRSRGCWDHRATGLRGVGKPRGRNRSFYACWWDLYCFFLNMFLWNENYTDLYRFLWDLYGFQYGFIWISSPDQLHSRWILPTQMLVLGSAPFIHGVPSSN